MRKRVYAKWRFETRIRDFRCMACGTVVQATKTIAKTVPGHIKTMWCYRCQEVRDFIQIGESQPFRIWGHEFEAEEMDEVTRQILRKLNERARTREETLAEVRRRLEEPMDGTRTGAFRILGLLNAQRIDIKDTGRVTGSCGGLRATRAGYFQLWINPEPEAWDNATAYLYQVGEDRPVVIWSRRSMKKYRGGNPYEGKRKKAQKTRKGRGSQLEAVTAGTAPDGTGMGPGRKGSGPTGESGSGSEADPG